MDKETTLIIETPDGGVCPVRLLQKILGGKWTFIILYYLTLKPTRFNELERKIPNISHGVLAEQLKELEKNHIVRRQVMPTTPPQVEYSLSELGQKFLPVMQGMIDFGKLYAKSVPVVFTKDAGSR